MSKARARLVRRYEVPADQQSHRRVWGGEIIHVDCVRRPDVVELWVLYDHDVPAVSHWLRVHGEGDLVHPGLEHVGSAVSKPNMFGTGGGVVWHLFTEPQMGRS